MLVSTAKAAADLLGPLIASAREERVAVAHLDPERRLIALTVEDAGTEDELELPVRSILMKALRIGAHSIVVAHNHPSGDPRPSSADETATRALAEAAGAVEIRLHDHLIFGGDECSSFRSLGLL